jgi:hypothetical protein
MWSPQLLPRRRQRSMTFEALSHGFGHHCLRFVPPSWTTTQNSLPVVDQPSGWAFPCPLSSFEEFHTFALPSPRASLGAKQFSFCGARLCAKHQPQRVDMQNRLVLCGRAAAGRDDTAALLVKIRTAARNMEMIVRLRIYYKLSVMFGFLD